MCTLLCSLILALLLRTAHASNNDVLTGRRQTCHNEGEAVALRSDLSNCFSCSCKNGFVECLAGQCPPVEDCYVQMPRAGCCARCKGCWYNGTEHASHSEWTAPGGDLLRCEAGVITVTRPVCYVPCANPTRTRHTHYNCSVCNECVINGQRVSEGRDVTMQEEPCLKCRCARGGLTCAKRACAVLPCPAHHQRTPPGECCPRCTTQAPAKLMPNFSTNKPCIMGNNYYAHESEFSVDACTDCTCVNGTAVCTRYTCPVVTCGARALPPPAGKCCPICPVIEEANTACVVGGVTHQDGDTWQMDACRSCECHGGEPRCALERCPLLVCPPDQQPRRLPGACCPRCEHSDGVCTVFGDPHYKTFDGKFYSFQGACKYQLVADCANDTFSVRIANDARNTNHSSWTRTVTLRTSDMKINLGKNMRVKVDGKRVPLPHELGADRGFITNSNGTVHVRVYLGVELLWDGDGFLEVTVSSLYRSKVCGLCGNFNSVARDDMRTRDGKMVTQASRFGSSWRVGGWRACTRSRERPREARCRGQAARRARRLCRIKRHDVFSECLSRVNPQNYRAACVRDACACSGSACHCAAYRAYARECRRLGAEPRGWAEAAWCAGTPPPWLAKPPVSPKSSKHSHLLLDGTRPQTPPARGRPPPPIH